MSGCGSTGRPINSSADDTLFIKVSNNPANVMFPLVHGKKELTYNLQPRVHQFIFPISSTAASKNFVQHMAMRRVLLKHAHRLCYTVTVSRIRNDYFAQFLPPHTDYLHA